MRMRTRFTGFLLATLLGASWATAQEAPPLLSTPTTNVVIYVVDGLRADHVGAYGYDRPTTPTLDAIAKEGIVFERCSAASSWSLPATASLLTGQYVCEHGAKTDRAMLSDTSTTLAQRLQSLGYATTLLSSNALVSQATRLERGFSDVQVRASLNERVMNRWQRGAHEPFFVYLHNSHPQDPYNAHEETAALFGEVAPLERRDFMQLMIAYGRLQRVDFDARRPPGTTNNQGQQRGMITELQKRRGLFTVYYDASLREVDASLGAFLGDLRNDGTLDRTLLIVAGSVGFELGEHDGWAFDNSLYGELTHVPLIIRLPGGELAGKRVASPVSTLDIVPTVLDLLGQAVAPGLRGVSLAPLVRDEADAAGPRVVSMRINDRTYNRKVVRHRGSRNVAVADGAWSGIWNVELDTFELYDLEKDPGQKEDVASANEERVQAMREAARQVWESCPPEAPAARGKAEPNLNDLPEDVRKALISLGYINESDADATNRSEDSATPRKRPQRP